MALQHCHDECSAGHLRVEKTLHKLQQEAYWVYMAKDLEEHCRQCVKCNQPKPPMHVRAPMTSVPIGKPWQMIAIDFLEIPLSYNNNRYLLVVQDYFTKWVDAIPMPNQTAQRIVSKLVLFY